MKVKIRALLEVLRSSLFFVPMLFVIAAAGLATITVAIDAGLFEENTRVPTLLASTVDSARSLLGTIAGATITFAGVAFAISLLMIQVASTQFSPRVLHSFFRDRFTKFVMGYVVGTFTYCLVVLRSVRKVSEEGANAVIPHVSVGIALVLGIMAILAILAFINHSAHSMQVSEIVRRITDETRGQIAKIAPRPEDLESPAPVEFPHEAGLEIRAASEGWVQQIDTERILEVVAPKSIVRMETAAGFYVAEGSPLCLVWPVPENGEAERGIRGAIHLGRVRTMQQDLALGIRQLVDIGLRALSPGVNDPTTAREAIVDLGSVLRDLLMRDLPPSIVEGKGGRRLVRPLDFTHARYVDLAFDEIRNASDGMADVAIVLLDVIGMLVRQLADTDLSERAAPLRRQAGLLLEGCARTIQIEADLERVRRAAKRNGLES